MRRFEYHNGRLSHGLDLDAVTRWTYDPGNEFYPEALYVNTASTSLDDQFTICGDDIPRFLAAWRGEETDGWVKVEDGLPYNADTVWIITKNDGEPPEWFLGYYSSLGQEWRYDDGGIVADNVIAWRPCHVPDLPDWAKQKEE